MFSPAADLAGNFVAGEDVGVFRVPSPAGDYVALPTICFEVAYDGLMRDAVLASYRTLGGGSFMCAHSSPASWSERNGAWPQSRW